MSASACGRTGVTLSRRCGGASYAFVLIAVAMLGASLAAAGVVSSIAAQREREEELLYAGAQFAAALASYHARDPLAAQPWPRRLEELLLDPRDPGVRRHLRRIHVDPVTGTRDWGLVRTPQGGIVGVYSTGGGTPLKRAGFPPELAGFAGAKRYAEWRFIAQARPPGAVFAGEKKAR